MNISLGEMEHFNSDKYDKIWVVAICRFVAYCDFIYYLYYKHLIITCKVLWILQVKWCEHILKQKKS